MNDLEYRGARGGMLLRALPADLRKLRYERRKSLVDVAAETGLSRSTVWRLENGGDVQMFAIQAAMDWMAKGSA